MSTIHSWHPDTLVVGLQDSCPRCEQHAAHPWASLDREHKAQLRERIRHDLPPRTALEALAMRNLQTYDEEHADD